MRPPIRACHFTLLLSCGLLAAPAFAASFDCSKARGKVEQLICRDPTLSALDAALASSYKQALATHPLPAYEKARQREWVKDMASCADQNYNGGSPAQVKPCVLRHYQERVAYLTNAAKMVVFSNSPHFSYEGGDLVAEYYPVNGLWHLSIWGGFAYYPQPSADAGKPIYIGCTFDGTMVSPSKGVATDADGKSVHFRLDANAFIPPAEGDICEGVGRLPDAPLKRVTR